MRLITGVGLIVSLTAAAGAEVLTAILWRVKGGENGHHGRERNQLPVAGSRALSCLTNLILSAIVVVSVSGLILLTTVWMAGSSAGRLIRGRRPADYRLSQIAPVITKVESQRLLQAKRASPPRRRCLIRYLAVD